MDFKTVPAVLGVLAPRETGSRHSPVAVEGYSFEEVQAALRYLKAKGYIVGKETSGLGAPPEIEVSA